MALLPNINVGSAPNDGTGSNLRDAFTIVNENFQLIEAFFPNSSVANLVANITSTGTSVFNIANVDVLNVNTISSFTVTDATISNNLTVNGSGTFGNLTVDGTLTGNIVSIGTSTFNIASYSGDATFDTNVFIANILTVDNIDANTGTIDIVTNETLDSNVITANSLLINTSIISSAAENVFNSLTGYTIVNNKFYSNGTFYTNAVTISTDVNLATDAYTRAQTIIANLTAGNLTVTLPNSSVSFSNGLTYTFICYDEGSLANRTLTVNVQPGAGNIWTSANTQATFVNISAELGTNSINLKNNLIYWFKF